MSVIEIAFDFSFKRWTLDPIIRINFKSDDGIRRQRPGATPRRVQLGTTPVWRYRSFTSPRICWVDIHFPTHLLCCGIIPITFQEGRNEMRGTVGLRYFGHKRVRDITTFKKKRTKAGFTQEKLAEVAGVELKVVQRAEQGHNITKENAEAIAEALKLRVDELFIDAPVGRGDERDRQSKSSAGAVLSNERPEASMGTQNSRITTGSESEPLTIAEAEEAVLPTEALYEYPGGRVAAIRLYGAADQGLAPKQIKVRYQDTEFEIPQVFEVPGEERIRVLTERRDRGEIEFFDGPCARLLHWTKPSFESFAQDGRQHLELVVGPIGWYDVERTNGVLRQKLLRGERIDYEHWIGLSALAHLGNVQASNLTNIIGNAITIFTTDGQVGYQDRGKRQSVGAKQLSSAIAENIHRYFDDTEPGNPLQVLHAFSPEMKLSDGPDNKKCPSVTGELHPAATVRRDHRRGFLQDG